MEGTVRVYSAGRPGESKGSLRYPCLAKGNVRGGEGRRRESSRVSC